MRYIVKYLIIILFCLTACIPGNLQTDDFPGHREGPVMLAVGVRSGGGTGVDVSKAAINPDGISFHWEASDKIALWARNSLGEYTLSGQVFDMLGNAGGEAVFTTTIAGPMPEDIYSYYACSPSPVSVNGTTAVFAIPSRQNGKLSDADIMMGGPVSQGGLGPYVTGSPSSLTMTLKHLVHVLKFYLPDGTDGINGESVRRLRVDMPAGICGTLSVDVTDPAATAAFSGSSSSFVLDLSEPLRSSSESERLYACAAVAPFSYDGTVPMRITLFSDSYKASAEDISISGRDFVAGHATPVKVSISSVKERSVLKFRLDGNFIGEDVRKITLTAPEGCVFGDGGGSTYVYEPGGAVPVGTELEFEFEDESAFRAFAGKTVTVAYDSEHVLAYQNIVPPAAAGKTCIVPMTAPYLLFEDFSGVASFSSNDAYTGGFSTGGKDGYGPFLGGWTGERIGGQAGLSVRLAARRETSARYHSRMDSAPLPQIKSPVDVRVSFDYSMGENHGGILSRQYGMNVYVGYVTSTQMYDNGSTAGTFNYSFNINETSGSYSSITDHDDVLIQDLPAGSQNRISWRAEVENHAGANNNTDWLYLDNVKVQVAQ